MRILCSARSISTTPIAWIISSSRGRRLRRTTYRCSAAAGAQPGDSTLARAGAAVWMAGAVGTDGRFLLDELAAAGVHTELVRELETVRTGNAIIQNDKTGGQLHPAVRRREPRYHRTAGEQRLRVYRGRLAAAAKRDKRSAVSHAAGAGARPCASRAIRRRWRRACWSCRWRQSICFCSNRVEAAQLAGTDGADEDALLRALRARFPEAAVVLTLGAQGAVYMDGGQTVRQTAFPAQAVDTTAAGDTFTAFSSPRACAVKARRRPWPRPRALRRTASRAGAQRRPFRRARRRQPLTADKWRQTRGRTHAGAAPFAVRGLR